jgi:hypothetical protein
VTAVSAWPGLTGSGRRDPLPLVARSDSVASPPIGARGRAGTDHDPGPPSVSARYFASHRTRELFRFHPEHHHQAMTDYVLAHHGDDAERQRMALLQSSTVR